MAREAQRSVLPISDQPSFGLVTYDARQALLTAWAGASR
jgi:hypothetical protein